jgi:hypothetical protein
MVRRRRNRRATIVRRLLEESGIRARLTQQTDGRELRVGPIPGADVATVIDPVRLVNR